MKIKTGLFGTRQVIESKDDRETKKAVSKNSSSTEPEGLGVQISEDSTLIQSFRQAAQGQEPVSAELIEQAKSDLAQGLLGSKEDFEQAITALLQEL